MFASLFVASAAFRLGTALPEKERLVRRDIVFSADTHITTYNAQFGGIGQLTTVAPGILYWGSGGGTQNFYGNINNAGSIYISQTTLLQTSSAGGQTVDFVGHDANNGNLNNGAGAVIQLNDIGAASAPTYDWYLRTMSNSGTLQFCGRGDTGGSTYQLYSDMNSTNTGLISFEQSFGNLGAAFVWRNTALYPPAANNPMYLNNEGAFRLINVVYHNVQNMYGSGCWQIGQGGVLYLEDGSGYYQNLNFGPTFPDQSIILQDSTAGIHLDTQVYSHNSNFGPNIYNFGPGNFIEFYEIFPSSNIFTYDSGTGILSVRFTSGNFVNLKLGPGYDPSLFYAARNPQFYNTGGYNAIFYRGAAPAQTVASQCLITAPVCLDLSNNPPSACSVQPQYNQALSPSRQTTLVCGSKGTLSSPRPQNSYIAIGSAAQCARLCAVSKLVNDGFTCFSFSYNPTTGDCQTYSISPVFMGYSADSTSATEIYNINCFGTQAETTPVAASCIPPYNQVLSPSRSSTLVCGTKGTLSSPRPQNSYTGVASAAACATKCANSKLSTGAFTCFSFAFNPSTGDCQTYFISPVFMGYSADSTSATEIYNINCFSTQL